MKILWNVCKFWQVSEDFLEVYSWFFINTQKTWKKFWTAVKNETINEGFFWEIWGSFVFTHRSRWKSAKVSESQTVWHSQVCRDFSQNFKLASKFGKMHSNQKVCRENLVVLPLCFESKKIDNHYNSQFRNLCKNLGNSLIFLIGTFKTYQNLNNFQRQEYI